MAINNNDKLDINNISQAERDKLVSRRRDDVRKEILVLLD